MKTLASELQRLQKNQDDFMNGANLTLGDHLADMMRLIERQARLLDAARDAFKCLSIECSHPVSIRRSLVFIEALDPNQPMNEE